MLLRKHVTGGRVSAIRQIDCDRILEIEIEHYDELGDRATKDVYKRQSVDTAGASVAEGISGRTPRAAAPSFDECAPAATQSENPGYHIEPETDATRANSRVESAA